MLTELLRYECVSEIESAYRGNVVIARVKHQFTAAHSNSPHLPSLLPSSGYLCSSSKLSSTRNILIGSMSDLYTALRVSPRKKRTLPEDDDNLLTPKRLRTE